MPNNDDPCYGYRPTWFWLIRNVLYPWRWYLRWIQVPIQILGLVCFLIVMVMPAKWRWYILFARHDEETLAIAKHIAETVHVNHLPSHP